MEESRRLGIQHLTLYAFSRENWSRPRDEVDFLFNLLGEFLNGELPTLMRQDIRLNILGETGELPLATRKILQMACNHTRSNQSMQLNLALNYSGRLEIQRACRLMQEKGLDACRMDPREFGQYLYTAGQPDPDLVIRTSGEYRISNFLLYQSAYSEFYFTETLWPDFDSGELHKALEDYRRRNRRFGGVEPV